MVAAVLADLDRNGSDRLWPIRKRLNDSIGSWWVVQDGAINQALRSAENRRWVSVDTDDDDRRVYTITERGAAALERWRTVREDELPPRRDDLMLRLVFLASEPEPELHSLIADRMNKIKIRLAELEEGLGETDHDGGFDERGRRLAAAGIAKQLEAEYAWLLDVQSEVAQRSASSDDEVDTTSSSGAA